MDQPKPEPQSSDNPASTTDAEDTSTVNSKDKDKNKDENDDKELTTKEALMHWVSKTRRFVASLSVLDWGLLLPLSLGIVATYVRTRHWAASNAIAAALAWQAVALVELDRFTTGSIVLGGLFLYDIFWVFGTNVMVSVARNFDAPIKITWPRNLPFVLYAFATGGPAPPKWELAMLGLGDIVVPGCFVALALRFDQHRYAAAQPSAQHTRRVSSRSRFPTPYFSATLAAYVAGLVVTMAVMTLFNAAQPALLYLSPACVGALAFTAAARGEWTAVWAWADIDEDAEQEKKDKALKADQDKSSKTDDEKKVLQSQEKEQAREAQNQKQLPPAAAAATTTTTIAS